MSKIFENENITYTKTIHILKRESVEKEITETVTKVVGRRCDICNHIFKNPEYYYEITFELHDEDTNVLSGKSTTQDICIKCIENKFKEYLQQTDYEYLSIYRCINDLG